MNIHHIAIWTKDVEDMKDFYVRYFGCSHKEKYNNPKRSFTSYFLEFSCGARLELMHNPAVINNQNNPGKITVGIHHFAISVGSRESVLLCTEKLRKNGYAVVSEPRMTGDGYFESCVLDPEGNRIEITV